MRPATLVALTSTERRGKAYSALIRDAPPAPLPPPPVFPLDFTPMSGRGPAVQSRPVPWASGAPKMSASRAELFGNGAGMSDSIAGEIHSKWSFWIDGMIRFRDSKSSFKTQFHNSKFQFSNCEIEKCNSIRSNPPNEHFELIRNGRNGIVKFIRNESRNERNEMSNSIRNGRADSSNSAMKVVLIYANALHASRAHWNNHTKQSGIVRVSAYVSEYWGKPQ